VAPVQFLNQLKARGPAAGCLFFGSELFSRDGCRRELIRSVFRGEQREDELVEYDLNEVSLAEVVQEARTLSLFSPSRLIVAYNAEAVLARRPKEEGGEEAAEPGSGLLEAYFNNPTPGVVLLIEALRLDWDDRDDRKKLERLEKIFSAVPVKVELRRLDERAALEAARALARQNQLPIAESLLAELVEALGHDVARVANEIDKLAVYSAGTREITRQELAALVPEARTSGLFELTDALGAKDRPRALEILDTLTRREVYLPLQVNFLAALFRSALAVKESGARNPAEVSRVFARLGLPIWPARARQASETANRFSRRQIEEALRLLFEADRDLRRERPEDRIIMERLVWGMTR